MPITCQYITLYGKWELADVVQLRQLRCGDYPGLSDEVHCNHKGLCKGMYQRRIASQSGRYDNHSRN